MRYNSDLGRPFDLAVSMGLVSSHIVANQFGVNNNVTTASDPEDVWEYGGTYVYDEYGTAPIQYISSSSTSDTGQLILVAGMDIEGEETYQYVTTNGQTNVELTTPLWRVVGLVNYASEGGDIVGTLYCHTDSAPTDGVPLAANVRAIISAGYNKSQMSMVTIPKGKVGFLFRGEAGITLQSNGTAQSEFARFSYKIRPLNGVFQVRKVATLAAGSSPYKDDLPFPTAIPALTDIKLTVEEVSDTMGVWGSLQVLLVDEHKLIGDYLSRLGQPGY